MAAARITKIRKRDGRIDRFDSEKIADAILKAFAATGEKDGKLSQEISEKVMVTLKKQLKPKEIPTVEQVQDIVETSLIEAGYAKVAKAYILYRQRRAEVRNEKSIILEKEHIDEVDKNFDVNSLRVLKARYLRKDESGKLIETPKQLFIRIALHTAIADLFYDRRVFDKKAKQKVHQEEKFDPAKFEGKLGIGGYKFNKYHLEAVKRLYDRFSRQRQMKVTWSKFFDMLKSGKFDNHEKTVKEFYDVMVSRKFIPNTPAVANFGAPLGLGSACFVLSVEDSLDDIMFKLSQAAKIFQAGGGLGYNFSHLRPEGDYISTTSGKSSGPISFMSLFDYMTNVIKQGGIRRGANMGILNSNHPDIEKFVTAKSGNKALRNFNISVLIMDDFWEHHEKNKPYPLRNPRNGKIVKYVNPRILFDSIVYQAWESAEPGVIFFDHVNKYNPFVEHLGPIITTNPCGEVLLYPYESCNLGSINVWNFVRRNNGKATVDWDALSKTIQICTRFLDNVIDVNKYPLPEIEEMTLNTRKIGLGVMGVADLLFELNHAYNNDEGRKFMEELMEFVNFWSKIESVELAKERGPMPYYEKSFYPKGKLPFSGFEDKKSWHFNWNKIAQAIKLYGIRNGYTTVIAPTGSISMIAGCSSGIEPTFTLVFEKNVPIGSFFYVEPVFERVMQEMGLYDDDLMRDIARNNGTIQNIPYIPPKLKKIFVTAMDIKPEDHIRALAAFQKWVDSSISKTNNFPASATVEDMKESYMLAYKLGCKDVTVFRDTSIKDQVLVASKEKKGARKEEQPVAVPLAPLRPAEPAKPGEVSYRQLTNCPECNNILSHAEGCVACPECGWGICT